MAKKDSFNEGRKSGGKFIENARKHPIAHSIDPWYNPKPYRHGDERYNAGVRKGIKDKKS